MVKKELDVFLSSDQEEFAKLRKLLSRTVCSIPFLTCTPLESRGADATNVVESSLKAVRDSDVYVGIFGQEYSATAIKEYNEAVSCKKPCLTYVKKVTRRDAKLAKFINERLKNEFHFFEFRTNKDLATQIDIDLRRFIIETLEMGLMERTKRKEEIKSIAEKAAKEVSFVIQAVPTSKAKDPLAGAETAFKQGNYLECLVMTTVALEITLHKLLEKMGFHRKPRSLGELISLASMTQQFSNDEVESIRKISLHRNLAVHLGDIPTKENAAWILETAKKLLSKISKITSGQHVIENKGK
jgi:HEPN domain-containing protein